MKKSLLSLRGILACAALILISSASHASAWDFSTVSSTDQANLNADKTNWTYDSSNNRWLNAKALTNATLIANSTEITLTQGLKITATGSDQVRIDAKKGSLTLNKSTAHITIPGLTAGDTPIGPSPSTPDHSTVMNPLTNQMLLTTSDNSVKYYNTADLQSVDIDKASGTVTVTPKASGWTDEYIKNVNTISFSKTIPSGSDGNITNHGVNITEAKGWLESVYAKWDPFNEATSYNVYIKGGAYSEYTKIDRELVRDYGSYCRADMTGLPANVYSIKVVPVVAGNEDSSSASEATDMTVKAFDRSGFAFHQGSGSATYDGSGIGAYKENGELKDNARVIYVTAETAKTVTCEVFHDKSYKTFTGLQAILDAFQKGTAKEPLCVRIIGTIRDTDMDKLSSSEEGLQIKGKNAHAQMDITIEGIGDDAAIYGFGMLLRNCRSVELRNFGLLWFMDDGISIDTDNSHIWAHHLDLFYGQPGSDSDQIKGDGSIDLKGDSQYITVCYNHFWDSGKMALCGMTSESGPNYIDYNNNWFDHSDSRHPRIRTMTVHVWNNYYDGVSKYGVGVTTGASCFVENNFFRHTKNPMLISKQGTDAQGSGTFSGNPGGIIKSFGNVYAEKGSSGNYTPITHLVSPTDFDCYEASSRNETVPSSYVAKSGGSTYDNFDTDPALMHAYTPIAAIEVPAHVMGYYGAGRLNKGDLQWSFDNTVEDTNYDIITALQNAVKNYSSKLVKTF